MAFVNDEEEFTFPQAVLIEIKALLDIPKATSLSTLQEYAIYYPDPYFRFVRGEAMNEKEWESVEA